MRLLCFSDLHRDREAAARLVDLANNVDCLVGAGDFGTCRRGVADVFEALAQIDKPAILVPGNAESTEELLAATKSWATASVLHGSGCEVNGVSFWGVGGGIPVTPFGDWSYDFDEAQASNLLRGCPRGGVLVVHSPPYDTVDQDSGGQRRGSRAIRSAVEEMQPQLVVCGHIHADWGKKVAVGQTQVLNAGPTGVLFECEFN